MTFRKNIIFLLTYITIVFLSSCEPKIDDSLVLCNYSNHTIAVAESVPWSDMPVNSIHFYLTDQISPNQSKTFDPGMNTKMPTWRFHIRDSKDKKLKFWVFNFDTLKKYQGLLTINQIVDRKLFDTILIYNENQIDNMKYQIVYSGRPKQ
jgi:hypothetical protein